MSDSKNGEANCQEQHLTALTRIIAEANRLSDLDDVLAGLAQVLVDDLEFEQCWIGLVDLSEHVLQGRSGAGTLAFTNIRDVRLPLTAPSAELAVKAVLESRTLIIGPDDELVPSEQKRPMTSASRRSLACVPIPGPEGAQGVISVARTGARPITPEDLQVLEATAQQIAGVLENARLFDSACRQTRRWAEVATASEALHQSLSLPQVLEAITQGIMRALGFRMVAINVRTGDTYHVAAVAGPPDAVAKLSGMEVPWADFAQVMQEQHRISRSYLIQHDRVDWKKFTLSVHAYRPSLPERGPGYWHPDDVLLIPMYRDGQIIGILSVDDPADGFLPDLGTIQALEVFADQAAVAIENARLHEALAQHAAELEARNRDLDAFAYSVSHDLRAPLTTVRGYVEALAMLYGEQLDQGGHDLVQHVQDGVDRMTALIDNLLLLSRASHLSGPGEEVNTYQAVQAVITRLLDMIVERDVQIEVPPDLPNVRGHAAWVEQVFVNLIDNAVKYAGRDNLTPHIVIGGQREEDKVHLWVHDNGLGLTDVQLSRLFEVFARFHGVEASGSGLGLAIVQRAVERMGGRVWAESPGPGQGSTFHFLLPAA